MRYRQQLIIGAVLAVVIIVLGCSQSALQESESVAADSQGPQAPAFEVDPFWPKPLPNHWIMGSTIGVTVDSRDHVYVIHRRTTFVERTEIGATTDPKISECCIPAPNILEFDPEGNLVNHFGGPGDGYDWPSSNHGITIDHHGNLWIGGNGATDSHILKLSSDGKVLGQFGKPDQKVDSNSTAHFGRVAKISIDPSANEAYVADGYGHRRVAVLDVDTGEFKRFWGAYGNKPDDGRLEPYTPDAPPAQQFRSPVHCVEPSNDGLVYVCDRAGDRIQVFRTDGTYVKEVFIAPQTLNQGSVWDIAFSKDPEQKYIYLADGQNMKVYIIERESLEVLTSFGDGGRQPGQFFAVHSIATDSKGNIYTTETYEGKRVQKFNYMGLKAIPKENQGVLWPGGKL